MTTDLNDLTLAQRNLVKTATGRLKDEFAGIFAAETIERFIADSLDLASGPQRMALSADQARAVVNGHGGNVSAAARQLGLARSTFRGLLHR